MMPEGKGEIPQTWQQIEGEQLRLYAQELAELYRKERELRQEVEAKNQELELRVQELTARELTALNDLPQKPMAQRPQLEEAFRQILFRISQIAAEANELRRQAESLALPDRGEKPGEGSHPADNPLPPASP